MKRCPQCNRVETDEALKFCRVDGATLVSDSAASGGEAPTAHFAAGAGEFQTSILPDSQSKASHRPGSPTSTPATTNSLAKPKSQKRTIVVIAIVVIGTALISALAAGLVRNYLARESSAAIQSIAVLPFENKNSDADTDYLSDGLAESWRRPNCWRMLSTPFARSYAKSQN